MQPGLSANQVAVKTRFYLPKLLGISIALPEQVPAVIETTEAVRAIPECQSVTIALGGYAVSQGLVPPIPGTSLCPTIRSIKMLLESVMS